MSITDGIFFVLIKKKRNVKFGFKRFNKFGRIIHFFKIVQSAWKFRSFSIHLIGRQSVIILIFKLVAMRLKLNHLLPLWNASFVEYYCTNIVCISAKKDEYHSLNDTKNEQKPFPSCVESQFWWAHTTNIICLILHSYYFFLQKKCVRSWKIGRGCNQHTDENGK